MSLPLANQRERVDLGVVHHNGLPRGELQSAVPLVGGHGLLVLCLDWPKERFVDDIGKVAVISFLNLAFFQSHTDLQFFAKVLRVGNEAAVSVPFVEPGAAANLCWLLLPIDSCPYAIIQLHVESPSVRSHNHILRVWLNCKGENERKKQKNHPSAPASFTLLCLTGETTFQQRGGVPELYVSSSWTESMMLKGSQILFDSTCLQ